jgi:hypothetical protein
MDCNEEWAGDAELDECGVCDGDNSSCSDCAGTPNGSAYYDNCGICDDDSFNDCVMDCNGNWGGPDGIPDSGDEVDYDECGVCGGDGSSCSGYNLDGVCGYEVDYFCGGSCSNNDEDYADAYCQLAGYGGALSYDVVEEDWVECVYYNEWELGGEGEVPDVCEDVNFTMGYGLNEECNAVTNLVCYQTNCTDSNACNYNPDATEDDGSCTYADEGYDCEGFCIVEDECGICNGPGAIYECGCYDMDDIPSGDNVITFGSVGSVDGLHYEFTYTLGELMYM